MAFGTGVRLGVYEIEAPIGAGGMGEVYRASDPKLGREVAIKVLPAAFAADAERLARFEREAKLLASLNHSNIAHVYGFESAARPDGTEVHFLAMELVPGEDLSERLKRGPVPLDEALDVAKQIAEALEEAHEKGIVHRDLKPANVKVTPDGKVKVLDFGLARAYAGEAAGGSAAGGSGDVSESPTRVRTGTLAGVILGTAAYMSPEQARGKRVDKRADIWAFGVVLYEMLTGARLFGGETVSDVLAAVLRADPDWSLLPPGLPAPVADLLRRCLERDPRRRLHDVADARIVLEDALAGRGPLVAETAPPAAPVLSPARKWAGRLALLLLGGAVATPFVLSFGRGTAPAVEPPQPTSFRQLTFLAGAESAPALAPDGESFVYVKRIGGQADIFFQRVGGSNAVNLTAGCALDDDEPAFSPDGKRIAYRSACEGGGIFVMGATGESARKVTELGHDPSWSPDGLELAVADEKLGSPFGRSTTSHVRAVRIETGEKRLLAGRDGVQPSWSPDGRRVAFWSLDEVTAARDLFTVAADGSQSGENAAVRVLDDPPVDWSPVWIGGGRALLVASTRGGTMNLWRIEVDPATGRPLGTPRPVTVPSSWAGYLSVSSGGRRVAYVDRNIRSAIHEASFDPVRAAVDGPVRSPSLGTLEVHETVGLSPDGGALVFDDAGLPQHLLLQGEGGGLRQLTEGSHRDRQGAFSPDGAWIAFQTDRWPTKLALIRPDGGGLRPLETGRTRTTSAFYPTWSPDGRRLACSASEGPFVLPMADGKPAGAAEPLAQPEPAGTAFWPSSFSPDGRLLAGTLRSEGGSGTGAAVYDFASRSYRKVVSGSSTRLLFLPDGKRLLVVAPAGLGILDLESGRVRPLVAATEGWEILWADLSRDGRHLAWHERVDESDVWMAEFGGGK